MTRQEQKAVKELSAMISKNTKVIAKEHGFKVVSDCAYKVLGDFLYEVFLSAPPIRRGTAIRAVVSVKPCVIDNVFWDAYEMGEVARKKPFSFHITAAHSPSAHIIEEMELPVPTVDAATLVMNEVFCRFNKSIQDHHSRCSTVSDFKAEILHDTAPTARLNVVLCEIAEGNFRQAVLLAETRQFCADGFAVKAILRLLDQLYLLAYCKRLSAEAVVESGQCNIVLHLYFLQNTCFIFREPVHPLLCLYYPLFMSNKNHFQITLVIF